MCLSTSPDCFALRLAMTEGQGDGLWHNTKAWTRFTPNYEERVAPSDWALIVDVDGTISPIAPTPDAAEVDADCRAALLRLAARLPLVAAVSGRAAAEAARLVAAPDMLYVGNHGLERWRNGAVEIEPEAQEYLATVQEVLTRLARQLRIPGVIIEPKGVTASVHFRQASQPEEAAAAIKRALDDLTAGLPLEVRGGKMVWEVRPALARNKGTAVRGLLADYRPAGVLYLGDDRTDVDAFNAVHEWSQAGHGWGVTVGRDRWGDAAGGAPGRRLHDGGRCGHRRAAGVAGGAGGGVGGPSPWPPS